MDPAGSTRSQQKAVSHIPEAPTTGWVLPHGQLWAWCWTKGLVLFQEAGGVVSGPGCSRPDPYKFICTKYARSFICFWSKKAPGG